MNKIIILKNDRVGDLFHSLDGINQIVNEHKNDEIEIYLSKYSSGFSFLFNRENINIKIINYNTSFIDKLSLYTSILVSPVQKIFILAPKSFYFILPLVFRKIKFYGICIVEKTKKRPSNFFKKFLYKFETNNRSKKNKDESINQLIFNLCKNENHKNVNLLNIEPQSIIKNFLNFQYCHFHFKKSLFVKKKWNYKHVHALLENIVKQKEKVILTSDIDNTEFNTIFRKNFSSYNFKHFNKNTKIDFKKSITYFENIESVDLFYLIKKAHLVIAPHGTMSVAASYLKKPVIDIFDSTINKIAFREYRPKNANYNFLILKPFSEKQLIKFNKFLNNV